MRKLLKFFIIIGILLVIIGGGLVAYGIVTHKFITDTVTNTYEDLDEFDSLKFDVSVSNINLIKSTDGKNKVECVETEKYVHDVKVNDNTLIINSVDNYKWYENMFNWSFEGYKVNVYLNETSFDKLDIEVSTGDVVSSEDFNFNNVKVDSSTGNITLNSKINDSIKIEASTGDVKIKNSDCNEIGIVSSTGNIEIKDSKTKKIKIETSTGDINLNEVEVAGSLVIDTSTGNVTFKNFDAETIDIETSTGDVSGNLLTGKSFDIDTSTGDINYPIGSTGGLCKVRTSTGDIDITVGRK